MIKVTTSEKGHRSRCRMFIVNNQTESRFLRHPGIQDGMKIWQKSRQIRKKVTYLVTYLQISEEISEVLRSFYTNFKAVCITASGFTWQNFIDIPRTKYSPAGRPILKYCSYHNIIHIYYLGVLCQFCLLHRQFIASCCR